jgi:hypothetical protein
MPLQLHPVDLLGWLLGGVVSNADPLSLWWRVNFHPSVTVNGVCRSSGGLRSFESWGLEREALGLGLPRVVLLSI